MNFGAKREIFENARELRKRETEAEKILWNALRSRRCEGLKFRRQHPVQQFILDFYCHAYLLGIEIDGSVHENENVKEHDLNRKAEIENLGINIIRFSNEEVLNNLTEVLRKIQFEVKQIKSTAIQSNGI